MPVFTNWNGERLALHEWAHLSTNQRSPGDDAGERLGVELSKLADARASFFFEIQ